MTEIKKGKNCDEITKKDQQNKTIKCFFCGEQTQFPRSQAKGNGEIFTCSGCQAKYFLELPENFYEKIKMIAEDSGKTASNYDMKYSRDFDIIEGINYNLYFIILKSRR